jgi:integrase
VGDFVGVKTGKTQKRTWLGGYIREGLRGQAYVIQRELNGQRFHISTKCRTERAALKELARFESAPHLYRPMSAVVGGQSSDCVLTPGSLVAFETYQLEVKRVTQSYADDCQLYLVAWMHWLAGRDLRAVKLGELTAQLAEWGPKARRNRIVTLKSYTKWLRRERAVLGRAEDPTMDLQVPRTRPEKLERRKAVPLELVRATLPKLPADVRELVLLLAATGLHVSEVRRFAEGLGGLHEPTTEQRATGVHAYLSVPHKTGVLHVVALGLVDAFEAAKAIRARGSIPSHSRQWFSLREAKADWNIGSLRHSHATWLYEAGTSLEAIAEQLGHRDKRTTADFYRDMGNSARMLPVPSLRLVEGGKS